MKFVQSLYLFKEQDHTLWRNSETHPDIWRLSNIYLNKIGAKCEFWGCDNGIRFIKEIGLKFDNIEKIPTLNINSRFWSLPKVYVASQQSEPFLHLDGDVFLKKWNLDNLPDFIVQNYEAYYSEKGSHWFYGFCSFLFRNKEYELAERLYDISLTHGKNIYNFGIFGGRNKEVSQTCDDVFKISEYLSNIVDKIPNGIFVPCVLEQIMIPMFLMQKRIAITTYLNGNIQKDADEKGYCHLLGPIKKKKETIKAVQSRISELLAEQYTNGL